MSKPTILYQVIPGATAHSWSWRIFRSDMSATPTPHEVEYQSWQDPEQKIYSDTGVNTCGSARTQARAQGRAQRAVARALLAYEMLARSPDSRIGADMSLATDARLQAVLHEIHKQTAVYLDQEQARDTFRHILLLCAQTLGEMDGPGLTWEADDD